jgi:hypothetical protein
MRNYDRNVIRKEKVRLDANHWVYRVVLVFCFGILSGENCLGEEKRERLALYQIHPNESALILTGVDDPQVKKLIEDYRVVGSKNKQLVSKKPLMEITKISKISALSFGTGTLQIALKLPKEFSEEIDRVRLNAGSRLLLLMVGETEILGRVTTASMTGEHRDIVFGRFNSGGAYEMIERVKKLNLQQKSEKGR